jgi:rootletin
LIDFTTRNRRETEVETERIRSSQTAAERALEAREKAHRARVKGLEEQVSFRCHPMMYILITDK